MSAKDSDHEARKARAEDLRKVIGHLSRGQRPPGSTPTPREIAEEAARKAAEETRTPPPPPSPP